jgi:hypothetical protein
MNAWPAVEVRELREVLRANHSFQNPKLWLVIGGIGAQEIDNGPVLCHPPLIFTNTLEVSGSVRDCD